MERIRRRLSGSASELAEGGWAGTSSAEIILHDLGETRSFRIRRPARATVWQLACVLVEAGWLALLGYAAYAIFS